MQARLTWTITVTVILAVVALHARQGTTHFYIARGSIDKVATLHQPVKWSIYGTGASFVRLEASAPQHTDHPHTSSATLLVLRNTTIIFDEDLLSKHLPGLPPGEYKIKLGSFPGLACYTSEELASNFVEIRPPNMSSCKSSSTVHTSVKVHMSPTRALFSRANTSRSKCNSALVVSSSGYWRRNTWEPLNCSLSRNYRDSKEAFISSDLRSMMIYIAGDSVSRGMFRYMCDHVGAQTRWKAEITDKTVGVLKQHCCRADHKICLVWRFTWYPLGDFFPEKFRRQNANVLQYCARNGSTLNHSRCVQTLPPHAFNWTMSHTVTTWHWLFLGSHSPALGASASTCDNVRKLLRNKMPNDELLIFGTPAIVERLIPDKYIAEQRVTRTNARIQLRNKLIAKCLNPHVVFDLFPMTFALPESHYTDAVHFPSAYAFIVNNIFVFFTSVVMTNIPA